MSNRKKNEKQIIDRFLKNHDQFQATLRQLIENELRVYEQDRQTHDDSLALLYDYTVKLETVLRLIRGEKKTSYLEMINEAFKERPPVEEKNV